MLLAAMLGLSGCTYFGNPPSASLAAHVAEPRAREHHLKPAPRREAARHASAPLRARAKRGDVERSALPGCGSNSECLLRLKALVEDPQHQWIGKPQPAAEYAEGIRLFAYRVLRSKLACHELGRALVEIDAAAAAYRRPVPGVTPDQARRVRVLSDEVAKELKAERASRCNS
jgi:hypothetical protein